MDTYDVILDTTGLSCPLPILRANKALNTMELGQVLRIIATDPATIKHFKVFSDHTGNSLLSSMEEGERFIFRISKG